MALLQALGRALRWLRDSRGLRQYQVAEAAGVTKAMLSAYETGRQKPSLDTLERLLEALGCDLADLDHALALVNERPLARQRELPPAPSGPVRGTESAGAAALFGVPGPLAWEEERALGEILQGLLRLLRHHGRALPAESAALEEPAGRRR
jgi:transcriptional regulator with XRE-family HTH domain